MRVGEFDSAVHDAKRTLETGKEYSDKAYIVLGGVNWIRDEKNLALEHLTKAISHRPEHPLAYVMRAIVRLDLGQLDGAISDLDAAIAVAGTPKRLHFELDGYGWQVYKFRGLLNVHRKDYHAAERDFDQAHILAHHDTDCLALRGCALLLQSDWDAASLYLRKAHDADPNNLLAGYLLTQLLIVCPDKGIRDGHHAAELATRLCQQSEYKNPAYLHAAAAAYAEIADFDTAHTIEAQVVQQLRDRKAVDQYATKIWWNNTMNLNISPDEKVAVAHLQLYRQHIAPNFPAAESIRAETNVQSTIR